MEIQQEKNLLQSVGIILKNQENLKKLRGENFNIFSILNMETKENATHSAFLGELLNPKGSHLFGSVFLKLFLETITPENTEVDLDKKKFNHETARLKLEKNIGPRDDDNKTGGRIDIFLEDEKGYNISIENKIHANDQHVQIERYVNYNTDKNKVFYLTLYGNEASEESRGDLKDGIDYFCISFRSDIITWLNFCMKEATEQPILRESIKQYIILIKKLTNQLSDRSMEKELQSLIIKNYEASKAIEAEVWKTELEQTKLFLKEVKFEIESELDKEFTVTIDKDLNKAWTGMKIKHPSMGDIQIKLEGQSKVPWSNSVYGICCFNKTYDHTEIQKRLSNIDILNSGFKSSNYWPFYKQILSFSKTTEKNKLYLKIERENLVKVTAEKMIHLAKVSLIPLTGIIKIKLHIRKH